MAVPNLEVSDRTNISTADKITFANSPIHLRIQNVAKNNTIQSVAVYLWIWNGNQNKVLGAPNATYMKSKISSLDDYINIEVADVIKAYLINPSNALNTNQPTFAYNELSNPVITGQGVFWQVIADVTSTTGVERIVNATRFATLGYRWNYEQNLVGNNGNNPNGANGFLETVNKWYNPSIHNYISQGFNLSTTVGTATSANLVTVSDVVPPTQWTRCSREPILIVFLNKLGLWEMFTSHGKVTIKNKIEAVTGRRSFRDPSKIDNSYTHSKLRDLSEVVQSYSINTGSLTEDMNSTIEQIIYSPKVYLIKFKGDKQTTSTAGLTIDSTLVTIDNVNITIDNATVGSEALGFFKTHQQIPVIVTDSDFGRKTRINDKNMIDYTINFEETTSKILSVR
jgi:hypothetical protein